MNRYQILNIDLIYTVFLFFCLASFDTIILISLNHPSSLKRNDCDVIIVGKMERNLNIRLPKHFVEILKENS